MTLSIRSAEASDLDAIHAAYEAGRVVQRQQSSSVWPEFGDDAVLREIELGFLQCVIDDDDELVGIFSAVYEDTAIWGEREIGAHIYLHRITRAAEYRGGGIVDAVVEWGTQQCDALELAGLRMDTWASNAALVAYYERFGFRVVGERLMPADPSLSPHYHGITLALLELQLRGR